LIFQVQRFLVNLLSFANNAKFDLRQARALDWTQHGGMERLIIFRCPATGLDVQTLLPRDEDASKGRHYESLTCPSCSQLHFVNRRTGKLLGYEKD
jgi:hypothetical protein